MVHILYDTFNAQRDTVNELLDGDTLWNKMVN